MTRQVLIAGATGTLGREVRRLLGNRDVAMRLLTRDPSRLGGVVSDGVEVVTGDARNPASLHPALAGVGTVISAMSGYGPGSGGDPVSVDWKANCNLIRSAENAGIDHFVLISAHGAASNHPMELMRMKFRAEQELKGSRLAWTIVRPTLFMDTWTMVVGEMLLRKRIALLFGRGENPINFVAARDVACLVDRAVADSSLRGAEIDIGGPENLTLKQVASAVAAAAEIGAYRRVHVPRSVMRLLGVLARPLNPAIARVAHDAAVMDSFDFTFDASRAGRAYGGFPLTSLNEFLRPAHRST